MKVLPSINSLYEDLDVDLNILIKQFGWGREYRKPPESWYDYQTWEWNKAFSAIFDKGRIIGNRRRNQKEFSEAAISVRAKNELNLGLLISGIINSSKHTGGGSDYNNYEKNNLVVRHLAKASGLVVSDKFDDQVKQFSLKVEKSISKIKFFDPSFNDQQLIIYHDGNNIKVLPFGYFGSYDIRDKQIDWLSRANLIQPKAFNLNAINELEYLLNNKQHEKHYQEFFEKYPEFLTILGEYTNIHSQLVLHEDNGQKLIPDFFLEKIDTRFCDILDIKQPSFNLVRNQKSRVRFFDKVQEGIGQLNYYRDWFESTGNRKNFGVKYKLDAYRPRLILVIGRSNSFHSDVERIKLESTLPKWVELKTYDDIMNRVKKINSLIT